MAECNLDNFKNALYNPDINSIDNYLGTIQYQDFTDRQNILRPARQKWLVKAFSRINFDLAVTLQTFQAKFQNPISFQPPTVIQFDSNLSKEWKDFRQRYEKMGNKNLLIFNYYLQPYNDGISTDFYHGFTAASNFDYTAMFHYDKLSGPTIKNPPKCRTQESNISIPFWSQSELPYKTKEVPKYEKYYGVADFTYTSFQLDSSRLGIGLLKEDLDTYLSSLRKTNAEFSPNSSLYSKNAKTPLGGPLNYEPNSSVSEKVFVSYSYLCLTLCCSALFYNNLYFNDTYDFILDPEQTKDRLQQNFQNFQASLLKSFLKSLFPILQIPQVSTEQENILLTFNLPYYLVKQGQNDPNKFMNDLIGSMLQDSKGIFYMDQKLKDIKLPVLEVLEWAEMLTYLKYEGAPFATGQAPTKEFTDTRNKKFENCIAVSYQVKTKIIQFSPMILVYMNVFFPGEVDKFSDALKCDARMNAELGKDFYGVLTEACFKTKCKTADDPTCLSDTVKWCKINYNLPPKFETSSSKGFGFLSINNGLCRCYYNGLIPALELQSMGGDIASMCYAKTCEDEYAKKIYNISNCNDLSFCKILTDRLENQDPTNQPKNADDLDEPKFYGFCGQFLKPYSRKAFNVPILFFMSIITILGTVLIALSLTAYTQLKKSVVIILTILGFLLMGLLTAYLTLEFTGTSICNGPVPSETVCQSRFLKLNLPDYYCNFRANCECQFDQNCQAENKACNCESGTCIPKNGRRTVIETQEIVIHYSLYIFSILVCILVFSILWISFRSVSSGLQISISVLGSLMILAIGIYYSIQAQYFLNFTGPCGGN